ncbi:hypothetical protein ACOME3_001269 [Neoechinorhynchus agilis]
MFPVLMCSKKFSLIVPSILIVSMITILRAVWRISTSRKQIINSICRNAERFANQSDCIAFKGRYASPSVIEVIRWFGLYDDAKIGLIIGPPIMLTITIGLLSLLNIYMNNYRRKFTKSVFGNSEDAWRYAKPTIPIIFPPFSIINPVTKSEYIPSLSCYVSHDSGTKPFLKYMFNFFFYRYGLEFLMGSFIVAAAIRLDLVGLTYILLTAIIAMTNRRLLSTIWPIIPFTMILLILFEISFSLIYSMFDLLRFPEDLHKPGKASFMLAANPKTIAVDCLILVISACHFEVFKIERNHVMVVHGGDNYEMPFMSHQEIVECFDFTESLRNCLDALKRIVYYHGIIISVFMLYLAATSNVDPVGLIYLFMSFHLLYKGNDLLLTRRKRIFRVWNSVIIVCYLIMTLRISLHSRSFGHVLNDLHVTSTLSAEGAKIYSQILAEERRKSIVAEEQEMNKISKSIDRIKLEQADLLNRITQQRYHHRAIRSWNRAMFQFSGETIARIPSSLAENDDDDCDDYYSIDNELVKGNYKFILDSIWESSGEVEVPLVSLMFKRLKTLLKWLSMNTIKQLKKRACKIRQVNKQISSKKSYLKCVGENSLAQPSNCLRFAVQRKKQSVIEDLFTSIYLFIAANSADVCYALMILCHAISGTVFSLILSLSAILWGMLCVPRPPSIYWKLAIGYTEAMICAKYILVFISRQLSNTNWFILNTLKPFSLGSILGVRPTNTGMWESFNFMDILLLVALSFHKSMLKNLNLFNNDNLNGSAFTTSHETIQNEEQRTIKSVYERLRKSILKTFNPTNDRLPVRDYYTSMFYVDIISIIILMMFYTSFGDTSRKDAITSLKENKVPLALLLLLLCQFAFIVTDRVLYLRKLVAAKIMFHTIQVALVHVCIFFILPWLKNRRVTEIIPAQLLYIVKCVYFALSAKQIKCGYPALTVGSMLSNSYTRLNLYSFKIMLLIPFMFELRSLFGWLSTETCLNITHWLHLEDMYSNVYQLKCWREIENSHPTPQGKKYRFLDKVMMGGSSIVLILLILWSPLLLFSLSKALFKSNPPSQIEVTLRFDTYPPIFSTYIDERLVSRMSIDEYNDLRGKYAGNKPTDLSYIRIPVNSTNQWSISPTALQNLKADLTSKGSRIEFECIMSSKKIGGGISKWQTVRITKSTYIGNGTNGQELQTALNGLNGTQVTIPEMYPSFIYVKGNQEAVEVDAFKSSKCSVSLFYHEHPYPDRLFLPIRLNKNSWISPFSTTAFLFDSQRSSVDGKAYYRNLTFLLNNDQKSIFWSIAGGSSAELSSLLII